MAERERGDREAEREKGKRETVTGSGGALERPHNAGNQAMNSPQVRPGSTTLAKGDRGKELMAWPTVRYWCDCRQVPSVHCPHLGSAGAGGGWHGLCPQPTRAQFLSTRDRLCDPSEPQSPHLSPGT